MSEHNVVYKFSRKEIEDRENIEYEIGAVYADCTFESSSGSVLIETCNKKARHFNTCSKAGCADKSITTMFNCHRLNFTEVLLPEIGIISCLHFVSCVFCFQLSALVSFATDKQIFGEVGEFI